MSRKEREDLKVIEENTLTYGEITFTTMAAIFYILDELGLQSGGTFLDLGSGSGKVCLCASLLKQFDRIVGVELLNGLFEISKQLHQNFQENFEQIVN